jgi:hypothetical protein
MNENESPITIGGILKIYKFKNYILKPYSVLKNQKYLIAIPYGGQGPGRHWLWWQMLFLQKKQRLSLLDQQMITFFYLSIFSSFFKN